MSSRVRHWYVHQTLNFTLTFSVDLSPQIAAQTAAPFNPNVKLTPIHGNIKESQYDIPWFQTFDIVLNALDNLGEPYNIDLSGCHHPTVSPPLKTLVDT